MKLDKYLNERKVTDRKVLSDTEKTWTAVTNLIKTVNSWEDRDKLDDRTKRELNNLLDNISKIQDKINEIL